MPALVAFGRKWEIGSDDFVYPVLFDLLIRLTWLVVTIIFYWKNGTDMECPGRENVRIFIYGVLTILHLLILANLALVYNSMKGGIMDSHARRYVPCCLYIRLIFQIAELGWNTLGTYWELKGIFDCEDAPETITVIQGLLISNWVVILFELISWLYQFDPNGNASHFLVSDGHDASDGSYQLPVARRNSTWRRKLKLLCCLTGSEASSKEMKSAFREGGKVFSYLLNGRNLVASDVVVGFTVLGLKTRELSRKRALNRSATFGFRTSINFDQKSRSLVVPPTEDWNSIENIIHFHRYAMAIFTIPASFCHRPDFFSNIFKGRKSYPIEVVESDTCCYSKSAAMRSFVDAENIVYISFNNSNFQCPFYVALDHSKRKIVIVVRGSFSCVDFVVDGMCAPTVFDMPGVPEHFRAHQGMLTSAKLIHRRLKELQILEKLKYSYPDYDLLLTGISLGAGLSTLLSIILKPDYPSLKCIAVSPTGALLSKSAAEYCNDFVVSLVYGEDMVPRFNLKSFYRALNQVEAILADCKTPKYQIKMGIGLLALRLKKIKLEYSDHVSTATAGSTSEVRAHNIWTRGAGGSQEDPENVRQNDELLSDFKLEMEDRKATLEAIPDMYCPGKILHVTETPLYRKGRGHLSHPNGPRWEIRWADRTEFSEVIISHRMFHDHIPFRLMRAFSYFAKLKQESTRKQKSDKNELDTITVQP